MGFTVTCVISELVIFPYRYFFNIGHCSGRKMRTLWAEVAYRTDKKAIGAAS